MDIQASISVLQATRPRLTMADLVALKKPTPDFEFQDRDKWFYSVKEDGAMGEGSLLEGNLICVTAPSPLAAEQMAGDGLQESVNHFTAYLSVGPEITTEARPVS